MSAEIPKPYYVAFGDEAGDPGLKAVRPVDPTGGTKWLCLGAVLTSASATSGERGALDELIAGLNADRVEVKVPAKYVSPE
jgi:hypothetical protein